MSIVLYKVTGPASNQCYIGYAVGDEAAARVSFMVGASRKSGGDRGARDLLVENDNDANALTLAVVEQFDNEFDAFMQRNDLRATDPNSITGPSHFPAAMYQRAGADFPEKQTAWSLAKKMRDAKTARDAYALGAWTFAQIKLANTVKGDLDVMTPVAFAAKYNLPFSLEKSNAA